MASFAVETFGWITITLLTIKSIFNLGHFVYTSFLGRWLSLGTDLRKCGPWAGTYVNSDGLFLLKISNYWS